MVRVQSVKVTVTETGRLDSLLFPLELRSENDRADVMFQKVPKPNTCVSITKSQTHSTQLWSKNIHELDLHRTSSGTHGVGPGGPASSD